eukprot:COSAG04_NODE_2809_length_3547_cov_2.186775_1_plen_98_part_10
MALDLGELRQSSRFAALRAQDEAEAEREAAELDSFAASLAAAGWSDAYDRVSGNVYYYHTDGRTTWANPLEAEGAPASAVATSMAARHRDLAATQALG